MKENAFDAQTDTLSESRINGMRSQPSDLSSPADPTQAKCGILPESTSSLCCVTVDVESDWGGRALPLENGVEGCRYALPRILNLFEALGVQATFFISTEIIKATTSQLREISSHGHEIASHGFHHRRYDQLDVSDLDKELQTSKKALEDLTGLPVVGFRSPHFVAHHLLFPALVRAGYKYDSSLVAGRLPRRYSNKIIAKPFVRQGILEIPVGRLRCTPLPSGLLWLNLIGSIVPLRWLPVPLERSHVFYLHPFDLYPARYDAEFGWRVNCWYRFRKKHAHTTLEGYIKRVAQRGTFVKMKDLLTFDSSAAERWWDNDGPTR